MSRFEPGPRPDPRVISDPVPRRVPIEPVGVPETPQPWDPGAREWSLTAIGGVMGAAVGGMLGIALLAGFSGAGGGAEKAALAGVAGIAALGALGLGRLAYTWQKGSHEESEAKRVEAEFGTSTLQNARDFLAPFDHDDDGGIDLVNTTRLPGMDEHTFTDSRRGSETSLDYDWWDGDLDLDTDSFQESRGVSAVDVWESANTAPKDDRVTDVELATLMSRYDADRNGALTEAEKTAFTDANPVIFDDWRR